MKSYHKIIKSSCWGANFLTNYKRYKPRYTPVINNSTYITYCFHWNATPQGFVYWAEIDYLWMMLCSHRVYQCKRIKE